MRKYIGRCDMCGTNLYEDNDTVTVLTGFIGLVICRNCCCINHNGRKLDITDLIMELEEKNERT